VSAIITDENGADSLQFIPLVQDVADMGFDISEVTADKGYSAIANYNAVQEVGGQAYIPFKSNATGTVYSGNKARLWRKMFHYFQLNQDDFMGFVAYSLPIRDFRECRIHYPREQEFTTLGQRTFL
jgi:hypothetical protein